MRPNCTCVVLALWTASSYGRLVVAWTSLHVAARQKGPLPMMSFHSTDERESPRPTPERSGLEVVTFCMDALASQTANEALEICFAFSSDRCRAAVGGTLEAFVKYADNPVFGTLVNCDAYEILSVGPIIPASSYGLGSRRGEMQTVLVEIQEGMSIKRVLKGVQERTRKRPTIEERIRQRRLLTEETVDEPRIVPEDLDEGKRRFLWTLQKELRPPRQNCWLVHEVLFTQNAIHQTY